MTQDAPRFHRSEIVVVRSLTINGVQRTDVEAYYLYPCPHPDYEGKHVVLVYGALLAVKDEDLTSSK